MTDRYRGRTTRERKLAEKVARDWAERRAAAEAGEQQVDLDRASVDAELELLDPAARRAEPDAPGSSGAARGRRCRTRSPGRARAPRDRAGTPSRGGAGRRVPDLAVLPRLLHETGSFATLRERLGPSALPAAGIHGRHVGLTTVPHGAKSYLAAAIALAAGGERLCWVARDAEIGDRVAEELGAWLGDPSLVAVLEPRTSLAYERSELVPDETAARVAALAAWRGGRAKVLVASVQALLQATLAPDDLPAQIRTLRPGSRVNLDALLAELLERGYTPVLEVAGRGEFARRGGILDVFPPSAELPVRIELFGDEIDSLRAFDPTDQRSVGPVREIALLPATEFLLPPGGADEIRARLGRMAARLPERLALDLARFAGDAVPEGAVHVTAGRALPAGDAAEVWCRVVAPHTGLDHVDPSTLFVLDEPGDLADAAEFLWRQAEERHAELVESGDLPKDWPSAYLPPRDWKARLHGARTLELTWQSEAATADGMAHASKGLTSGDLFGWRDPVLPPGRTERLVDGVEHWLKERARVVLVSDQAPRLAELLGEAGHPVGIVSRIAEAPPPGAIALVERSLNGGFEGGPDGLAVVTDRELFGTVRIRRPKAMRRVVPRDILERLTAGDLVVHIDHGIARYEQMLRRGEEGQERDYLELSFAAGDRIFVPVEQINRISRYSGGESPQLSRLGGTEWLRTKQRVRKAVTDLAEELLRLYAKREAADGFAYAPDSPWQAEMEASFPYEETPDQLRAAVEVKADMETRRPMDRLVVGDVGYGKTEVALRAAFKATQDGKQVAVLVPTTVLAGQHFTTFSQRFAAFPITVKLLSRFVGAKDQDAAIAGLASGGVDIVIGTHRLLSQGRGVPGPGPRRGGRGAAVRGRGEGAAQAAAVRRGRADALRHADPADAQPGAGRDPGHVASSRPRPRTACRSRRASRRRPPASSGTRSCASSTAAARSSTSTTGSRPSRPRPSSCGGSCPGRGSAWATGRWARTSWRR